MIPELQFPEVMDESDRATQREQQAREAALERRRSEAPPACGYCFNCGETLFGSRRWCDADCRADWERSRRRARTGVIYPPETDGGMRAADGPEAGK
jgi:hypothetical protein